MLERVIEFVNKAYNRDPIHFKRTVYWLRQLKPDADEPMLIAAYAHDIERAFARSSMDFWKDKELNDSEYLKKHQFFILVHCLRRLRC